MIKKFILIAIVCMSFIGCTDNQAAKSYGGTATINIPANKKLVNITWKDANMWILTRERRAGEPAERYEFKEDSTFGILEGNVVIVEAPSVDNTPASTPTPKTIK